MSLSWAARRTLQRKAPSLKVVDEVRMVMPNKADPWKCGLSLRKDDRKKLEIGGEVMRALQRGRATGNGRYTSALGFLGRAGLGTLFETAWEEMLHDGVTPGVVEYNAKLQLLAVKNRNAAEAATSVWREMKQAKVTPDEHSWRFLTKALVVDGQWETALKINRKRGACSEEGKQSLLALIWGAPDLLKAEMVVEQFNLDPIEVSVVNSMISAAKKSGDVTSAERLFAKSRSPASSAPHLAMVYASQNLLPQYLSCLKTHSIPLTTTSLLHLTRCATPSDISLVLPTYRQAHAADLTGNISIHTYMLRLVGPDINLVKEVHKNFLADRLRESAKYRKTLDEVFEKLGEVAPSPVSRKAPMPKPGIATIRG